jgi:predicted secreted protein
MGIVSGLVLFAVIWFMVLFVVLPIRLETQGDRGEIVPGTQPGAPANLNMKRKAKIVTLVSVAIWIVIAGIILSGAISVQDLDWFQRMGPPSMREG